KILSLRRNKFEPGSDLFRLFLCPYSFLTSIQLHLQVEFSNFMFNMLTKNDDVLRPIIIPEKQMLQFISLTSNEDNDLIYLSAEDSVLKKGTRVKIMDGEFKNFEGRLTKIKGLREKRVVLDIDNVLSVAMCCIDAKFIEILR
ncbi:MAG: hypothetical protein R3Y38_05995, partial [Rikenellaceae bacterium]